MESEDASVSLFYSLACRVFESQYVFQSSVPETATLCQLNGRTGNPRNQFF